MLTLAIVVFLVLMVAGLDVGFSMLAGALIGLVLKTDLVTDVVVVPLTMHNNVDVIALIAVPLFVLAGEFMNQGGVTRRLIEWSMSMVGHWRGSLSQVSVVTNFIMAGISGSAVADASAIGAAMLPSMKEEGYRGGYAGAVIAAGAMLGPIIPPSIPMIVYAVVANASVIRLFLSGVVPGILLTIGYMALCWIYAKRHGYPTRPRSSWRERATVTRKSIWALIMPVIIVLGIRSGLFTDTEASAVIALYALVVGVIVYRELPIRNLPAVFYQGARTAGVILFLLAASGPFAWLLSESQMSEGIAEAVLSVTHNPFLAMMMVNVVLLLMGTILEPLPAMIIATPALLPLQHALGLDPTFFGLIIVLNLMIGMLHPPMGLLLFVVAGVGKIPILSIAVSILPFLAWALVVLTLCTAFPPLATWLPNLVVGAAM
jgi:tripartite ATP-independent transporter DctM subunit